MPKLNPAPLHIVFCQDGSIFFDGTMAVFANEFHADELIDRLRERGSGICDCRKHTKVTYLPISDDYDWYICPMCPEKNALPIKMKGVNVRCDCDMMMFPVKRSDPRVRVPE